MKKLVVFKLYSQGRISYEPYEIGIREKAESVGQALIVWFNMTGGNRDGSYRRFVGVEYEMVVENKTDYLSSPFRDYRFEVFKPINVLGEEYEKLLELKEYYGE